MNYNEMELVRMRRANVKLRKHDMKIIYTGEFLKVMKLPIGRFTSSELYPNNFRSVQSALDWLCAICHDSAINLY